MIPLLITPNPDLELPKNAENLALDPDPWSPESQHLYFSAWPLEGEGQ